MLQFNLDQSLSKRVKQLASHSIFAHIDPERLFIFTSTGANTKALARIWSFPRIYQIALKQQPAYCIEFILPKFAQLSKEGQAKVILHELLHIPKTFSGAILPHRGRGKLKINQDTVNKLYQAHFANPS